MNYIQYLNKQHSYQTCNCLSLIAEFYEKELHIELKQERELFNNFTFKDIKEIRRISVDQVYNLKNWIKISLTELQEFDIIVYTKHLKLAHFAMYTGDLKILDLKENQKSVLQHFNDRQRENIDGIIRHKSLVT